jgi:fatty acid desaturase
VAAQAAMTRRLKLAAAIVLASLLLWPFFGMWGLFGILPLVPVWIAIFLFWPSPKSEDDQKLDRHH